MLRYILASAILGTAVCSFLSAQQHAAASIPAPPSAPASAKVSTGTALFRLHADCGCVRTHKSTNTLQALKLVEGPEGNRTTFQSYRLRSEPDMEIFRVPVEWSTQGEGNAWWNYGISDEGDFNGDGQPDYAWYGGDDSGSTMLLFLSSHFGYQQVDVLKTIEEAWEKRFHQPAPDFTDPESTDWALEAIRIRYQNGAVTLNAVIVDHPDNTRKKQPDIRLEIAEGEFAH